MKKSLKSLEEKIYETIKREGLIDDYEPTVKVTDAEVPISAYISNDDFKITIEVNKDIESALFTVNKKFGNKASLDDVLYSTLMHEKGHHKAPDYFMGCPGNKDFFKEIILNTSAGLEEAGLRKELIEKSGPRVANMFMDLIVNSTYSLMCDDPDKFKTGIKTFYYTNALKSEYTPGFSIFVETQNKIALKDEGLTKLSPNAFITERESNKVVRVLLERLSEPVLRNERIDDSLIYNELMNRDAWGIKAKSFAIIMAPYVDDIPEPDPKDSNFKSMNDDSAEAKDLRRELMKESIERGEGTAIFNNFELVDVFFQSLAQKINIEMTENNKSYIAAYLSNRSISDDETVSLTDIDFMSTKLSPLNNDLILYKNTVPLSVSKKNSSIGSLDDICFMVDTSGSMDFNCTNADYLRRGNLGKYDLSVIAFYSIIEHLKTIKKADQLKYNIILFGDSSKVSGWKSYHEIDEIKKFLLTQYDRGGVERLDPNEVKRVVDSASDKFLTFLISDGQFVLGESFVNSVMNSLNYLINHGNKLTFLEIDGRGGSFTEKIKNLGAEVIPIITPDDLVNKSFNKTRKHYARLESQ